MKVHRDDLYVILSTEEDFEHYELTYIDVDGSSTRLLTYTGVGPLERRRASHKRYLSEDIAKLERCLVHEIPRRS